MSRAPRTRSAAVTVILSFVSLAILAGCATSRSSPDFTRRWALRGLGGLSGFALHEVCHLALGAILGSEIGVSWKGAGINLSFGDISGSQHRAVAFIGNACTGLVAEIVVDTGSHKQSHFLQGLAGFHAINTFGYAFSDHGDAEHFTNSGGKQSTWIAVNAVHSSRIATQLGWDQWRGLGSPPIFAPRGGGDSEDPIYAPESLSGTTVSAGVQPSSSRREAARAACESFWKPVMYTSKRVRPPRSHATTFAEPSGPETVCAISSASP